ncbi:MAG TPA: hypothetical protein VKW09_05085 [bacterium]|nr:hypothetical protein [bacterium]
MPRPDALLCRIGYAEEWLRRARHDWLKGDGPAAVRRLMLAEAEIRHARESHAARAGGPAGRPHPAGQWRLVAGLAAAAMVAAGLGYASMWTATPPPGAGAARGGMEEPLRGGAFGRTIVQLDTGRFLMPNLEQAPTDNTAAGSGVIAPAPPADGVPGDAGFAETGSRTDGGAVGRPARVTGVPVNLKTSSPTF